MSQAVIWPCFKKARQVPRFENLFSFWDLFLYHEGQLSNTAQSVIDLNSMVSDISLFIYLGFQYAFYRINVVISFQLLLIFHYKNKYLNTDESVCMYSTVAFSP
jgi:hypothetical protein